MDRVSAAKVLGVSWKTLMWWERDEKCPFVHLYPAVIEYLGYEPWEEPSTLGEALIAERRRRGLEIRRAAELVGVDEGTWRRWERGEWKPTGLTIPAIDRLLGYSVRKAFRANVR
jgi:DNA-binding transcriptional regulator YiaG